MNRAFVAIVAFTILSAVAVPDSFAEEREQKRIIEETKRKILELTEFNILKGDGRLLIDYGAWLDPLQIDLLDLAVWFQFQESVAKFD